MTPAEYFAAAFCITGGVICAIAVSTLAGLFGMWLNSLTARK